MTPPDLDRLLGDLARQPLPALDARFADDVRREVRLRRAESSAWGDWLAFLLRPQPVAAALAVALLCGLWSGSGFRAERAGDALALDVFSTRAAMLVGR